MTLKVLRANLGPTWHQDVMLTGSIVRGIKDWVGQQAHGYDLVDEWMREGTVPIAGLITRG